MVRCFCGKVELTLHTNTGSPVRLQDFTVSKGISVTRHTRTHCDGYWAIRNY